jgi:hypothetical protein
MRAAAVRRHLTKYGAGDVAAAAGTFTGNCGLFEDDAPVPGAHFLVAQKST